MLDTRSGLIAHSYKTYLPRGFAPNNGSQLLGVVDKADHLNCYAWLIRNNEKFVCRCDGTRGQCSGRHCLWSAVCGGQRTTKSVPAARCTAPPDPGTSPVKHSPLWGTGPLLNIGNISIARLAVITTYKPSIYTLHRSIRWDRMLFGFAQVKLMLAIDLFYCVVCLV